MSLKKIVANNLKNLRMQNGLSRKEAAEKLNLTSSYLSYLERGERTPGINIIEKIAQLYNVEPYILLTDPETDYYPYFKSKLERISSFGHIHKQFIMLVLDAYIMALDNGFQKAES